MITQYLGNDRFKLFLISGVEIELSGADIEEIAIDNLATKTKIDSLENDIIKYRDYYHIASSKLETNRETMKLVENILQDLSISNDEKLVLILEQLKIE